MTRREALADAIGLDHHTAGGLGLARGEPHIADALLEVAPFAPQIVQRSEAADIALAPRRDPIGQPVLFADDLAVELVAGSILFIEHGIPPRLEGAEAAAQPARRAAIEPDGRVGQVGQESPVVADDHQGRAQTGELRFQPFDGGQIEVVGGLIEQQHVRLGGKHLRQSGTTRLAPGQMGRILATGEAEPLQQVLRAIGIVARLEAGRGVIERGSMSRKVRLLRQVADGRAGLEEPHSRVGGDGAGGDLQQRRLARAVAADERDFFARQHGELGVFEELRGADRQSDLLQGEDGSGGHVGADRSRRPGEINRRRRPFADRCRGPGRARRRHARKRCACRYRPADRRYAGAGRSRSPSAGRGCRAS